MGEGMGMRPQSMTLPPGLLRHMIQFMRLHQIPTLYFEICGTFVSKPSYAQVSHHIAPPCCAFLERATL